MPTLNSRPPLLVIAGPTATGKTRLALDLAEHAPIEVISADSRQVYCGLDVASSRDLPVSKREPTNTTNVPANPKQRPLRTRPSFASPSTVKEAVGDRASTPT